MCKAAGRPFPQLVDDDVLDYLITEAVAIRVSNEDANVQKEAQRKAEIEQKKREAMLELNKHR